MKAKAKSPKGKTKASPPPRRAEFVELGRYQPAGPWAQFCIDHIEKVIFGVMACFALCLFASALKIHAYDDTPAGMKRKADDVISRLEHSRPPESFSELAAPRDLQRRVRKAFVEVDSARFPMFAMAPIYSELRVRRKQPELFAVSELKAFSGFGAIAISESDLGRERFLARSSAVDNTARGGAVMPAAGPARPAYQPPQGYAPPGAAGVPMAPGQRVASARGGRRRGRRIPPNYRMPMPQPVARPAAPALPQRIQYALSVPSGARLDGRYWVCLVGLIPAAEQEATFQRTFRDAMKTFPTDVPQYVYCDVERAEVDASGNTGEFKLLEMDAAADDMAYWAAVYPEPVDPRYLTPSVDVSSPLPPLVLANHDANAVRHPDVPLLEETRAREAELAAAAAAAAELKTGAPKISRRRQALLRRRGQPGARPGAAGAGPFARGAGMPNVRGRPGLEEELAGAQLPQEDVKQRLFRFFDFGVEPSKQYKYRVRLALYNPNFAVPVRYLAHPSLREQPELFTDWSPPTSTVAVASGTQLLTGGVDPVEPKAKVLVRQFDAQTALTTARIFDLPRGATANAAGVEVADPSTAQSSRPQGAAGLRMDLKSDVTLVDMAGGNSLPDGRAGAKAPGRVLVMTRDGDLSLHCQCSEAANFEKEAAYVEQAQLRQSLPGMRQ